MKVVHFIHNTLDGSGKAAYRLHKALQEQGVESLMLVFNKTCEDDSVVQIPNPFISKTIYHNKPEIGIFRTGVEFLSFIFQKFYWKLLVYKWKPRDLFNFNIPFISFKAIEKYLHDVDIICLYSTQSFLSTGLIRDIYRISKASIVWTLMDIEPLTGGCHFNNGCDAFTKSCGNCPQMALCRENDISRRIWKRKQKNLKEIPITFVAVNSWSREYVAKSSLFRHNRVENIFLGIDNKVFKKIDKKAARRILNLPENDKVILFGCFSFNDKRKGANYLKEVLKSLPQDVIQDGAKLSQKITLVTFGRRNGFSFSDIPFKWVHFGELKDDRAVALAYQAADLFACPSIDDLGPMMVNEAFMCEVPVIAFNSGIARDLIKSEESGYTARIGDVNDYRRGIVKYLFNQKEIKVSEETQRLRQMCGVDFQAQQYQLLFKKLLEVENEDFVN